jgi:hypothetical protein
MSMPSRILFGSLLLASVTPQTAVAQQAWVGEPGSLSVSLDYAYSRSDDILDESETLVDPIFSHTAALGIEYTPIEKLALIATVPVVASRYDYIDPMTDPPHGRYDDGNTHTALQDFRLDVRYMVLDDVVTISPHVAVSVPMTNYETVGYAAAGRGLKMLIFGAALGKYFTSGVPNLYIHGRYEFRLTESYEVEGYPALAEFPQNKSFMDALIGYYILDTLEVNAAASLQLAHGGFEFANYAMEPLEAQYYHDPLLAESFLHVGGGLSYQALEKLRVSAFVRFFMWGENTRNSDIYGLSLSWDAM